MLGVRAYYGWRVGEPTKLRVGSYRTTGGDKVEIYRKDGKERRVPLHPEAFERREMCLDSVGCLVEAVRSADKTIDIDKVNRVLLQPHWQKDADLVDY